MIILREAGAARPCGKANTARRRERTPGGEGAGGEDVSLSTPRHRLFDFPMGSRGIKRRRWSLYSVLLTAGHCSCSPHPAWAAGREAARLRCIQFPRDTEEDCSLRQSPGGVITCYQNQGIRCVYMSCWLAFNTMPCTNTAAASSGCGLTAQPRLVSRDGWPRRASSIYSVQGPSRLETAAA